MIAIAIMLMFFLIVFFSYLPRYVQVPGTVRTIHNTLMSDEDVEVKDDGQ